MQIDQVHQELELFISKSHNEVAKYENFWYNIYSMVRKEKISMIKINITNVEVNYSSCTIYYYD